MDRRSIVLYLNRKGRTAQIIHDDLAAALSAEAIAYNTVTIYLRMARIIPPNATSLSAATPAHIDQSDEAILSVLEEYPLSSVRQPAHATSFGRN
jgi:hypothetical protein